MARKLKPGEHRWIPRALRENPKAGTKAVIIRDEGDDTYGRPLVTVTTEDGEPACMTPREWAACALEMLDIWPEVE